jgi:hypothetical protein
MIFRSVVSTTAEQYSVNKYSLEFVLRESYNTVSFVVFVRGPFTFTREYLDDIS